MIILKLIVLSYVTLPRKLRTFDSVLSGIGDGQTLVASWENPRPLTPFIESRARGLYEKVM